MNIGVIDNVRVDDWAARLAERAVAAGADNVEIFLRVEEMVRLHWTPYQGVALRSGAESNVHVQLDVDGQTVTFVSDALNAAGIESRLIQTVRELIRTPRERVKQITWVDAARQGRYAHVDSDADAVDFLAIRDMMRKWQERFVPSAFHLHRWECISGRTFTALVRSDGQMMSDAANKYSLQLLLEGRHGFLLEGTFALRAADFRTGDLEERIDQLLAWPREETTLQPGTIRLSIPPSIGADIARKYGILFSGPRLLGSPELAGLIGKRLAKRHVTLVDDACLPGGWASRAFDEEGTPSQRTVLIDSGVMAKFLHSTVTAQRWGVTSTGNGVRSRNHSDSVSPSNIYFVPGGTDHAEWRRQTDLGVEIVHAVQPPEFVSQNGMIRFVADGWLIRGGKRERQVSSVAVALHPFRFLRKLSSFGSDLTFFLQAKGAGSPTIFVDDAEVQEGHIVI
ncbi:metallopeptidase TldD-related protein [Brevibacillus sp. MCWH]|uniref:metallopeptidase TldD-related protein n=1 Tax=Brevibacillus sp. MCWH TaxID=2508871 RepID=UPI0014909008|nr:metallopeptidase TldD-related protein [Brevibacillus sp. MCWH]NNV01729.1 hypothetical protein [Brevibacillus sp. MCWH]